MWWVEVVMSWSCDELKLWWDVMRCDEMWWDVMKNVSLTCHLIYYDEDVLRVCWNKSCDEVVKMCWRIIHKLWKYCSINCFISCDETVVMKYSMKYVMKYSMKFCHYNCCDEELFHRIVEDVLKMCWRIVS